MHLSEHNFYLDLHRHKHPNYTRAYLHSLIQKTDENENDLLNSITYHVSSHSVKDCRILLLFGYERPVTRLFFFEPHHT